jgi:hypothetical protein
VGCTRAATAPLQSLGARDRRRAPARPPGTGPTPPTIAVLRQPARAAPGAAAGAHVTGEPDRPARQSASPPTSTGQLDRTRGGCARCADGRLRGFVALRRFGLPADCWWRRNGRRIAPQHRCDALWPRVPGHRVVRRSQGGVRRARKPRRRPDRAAPIDASADRRCADAVVDPVAAGRRGCVGPRCRRHRRRQLPADQRGGRRGRARPRARSQQRHRSARE